MKFRKTIGKITSPVFVPLRRLIVWTDDKFGTCDHQLVLQPRPCIVEFDAQSQSQVSEPQIAIMMFDFSEFLPVKDLAWLNRPNVSYCLTFQNFGRREARIAE